MSIWIQLGILIILILILILLWKKQRTLKNIRDLKRDIRDLLKEPNPYELRFWEKFRGLLMDNPEDEHCDVIEELRTLAFELFRAKRRKKAGEDKDNQKGEYHGSF